MTARERAIAFRHAAHERVCDVIEPWEHGTAVRCTRLPSFWNYNSLRLEGADPGAGVDALVHSADVLQGDMRHRQVEIEDETAGARLRPGFSALGWATERLAWLRLAGSAPGPDVEHVAFEATRQLRLEWTRTFPWGVDEAAAQELADMEEDVARVRGTRAVIARDDQGLPTGYASFVEQGESAEIEQVYVTPERRDRGTGGALVAGAVRGAGAGETFIIADDAGDSKRLYERLGFRTVWIQHVFTRRPG